jgi:hypothetical protein
MINPMCSLDSSGMLQAPHYVLADVMLAGVCVYVEPASVHEWLLELIIVLFRYLVFQV